MTMFEVLPFAEKAQLKTPVGLVADAKASIYVADMGLHAIVKITPTGEVNVLAGGKEKGFKDGLGANASFYRPTALAIDSKGNLIVADSGNNRIRKVTPDGEVHTVAGNGEEGAQDGTAEKASFKYPQGVAVDGKDNIYVADTMNDCIRKISPNGVVTTFGGKPGQRGKDDGVNGAALFDRPHGLWLDVHGTLFVADSQNNMIRIVDTEAGNVKKWVGCGQRGHRDGAKHAGFALPTHVVADVTGNIYVADTDNHCIRRVDANGNVETIAGAPGKEGSTDGFGDKAAFKHPRAIVLDQLTSTLLVADSGNGKIRKLRPVDEVQWQESMVQQAQQFRDQAIRDVADMEYELQEAHKRKAEAIVALGLAQRHLEQAKSRNRPLLAGSIQPLLTAQPTGH